MTLIIALIVPLIFGFLAKVMPYKASPSIVQQDFGSLKNKYQKWEFLSIIILFIFIPATTYVFRELFTSLYHLLSEKDEQIVFKIDPDKNLWFLPACILSFALIGYPMNFVYKIMLGNNYDDYLIFTNLKHGFDGMRVLRYISITFGILTTIILVLMSDYSIKIYPDKIIQDDFITLGQNTYGFNQIKSISFVQNIETKQGLEPDPYYVIKYNDNRYWNTNTGLKGTSRLKEITHFLSIKSNKPIDTLISLP